MLITIGTALMMLRSFRNKRYDFYLEVRKYERLGVGTHGEDISLAMDYGDNRDVQRVLCQYIDRNEYPADIKDYIRSQVWVV